MTPVWVWKKMSPLALCPPLVSAMQLAFFKLQEHQWLGVPLPAPIFSRLSLNCLLSPELPSTQRKLLGSIADGACRTTVTVLGEKRSHLLRHLKWPAHEMPEAMLGSLQSEENGISRVLNMNPKAALLEPSMSSTSLLAFPPSLLPEGAAHEELTFGCSLHPSVIPFPRQLCYRLFPGPQPTKALCLSLHINRGPRLDRWMVCYINSNPPNPMLDSAIASSNGNFLIPDFSVLL